jgi:FkbM family methyltransferase
MILFILKKIKHLLKAILPPKLFLRLLILKRGNREPELKLIPILCDQNKISIDIGASEGLYTAPLYFYSSCCIAFEPRIDATTELKKMSSGLNPPIQIEQFALSNFSGTAELKIYTTDRGRSTMEKANLIEKNAQVQFEKIKVKRLDDYNFNNEVGFIKIDVEGQEEEVLRGSENLLKKDLPNLLVEIEERHKKNSIINVISYLNTFGYSGYFLRNGLLIDVQNFDVNEYQNINNIGKVNKYINNFIFISSNKGSHLHRLIKNV